MLLQMSFPVEKSNELIRTGELGKVLEKILKDMKPEAAYFCATNKGERGGFIVFDMKDPSQIPAVAEPLFLKFNATLSLTPAMNVEDLAKAGPGIEKAVKEFGK